MEHQDEMNKYLLESTADEVLVTSLSAGSTRSTLLI